MRRLHKAERAAISKLLKNAHRIRHFTAEGIFYIIA